MAEKENTESTKNSQIKDIKNEISKKLEEIKHLSNFQDAFNKKIKMKTLKSSTGSKRKSKTKKNELSKKEIIKIINQTRNKEDSKSSESLIKSILKNIPKNKTFKSENMIPENIEYESLIKQKLNELYGLEEEKNKLLKQSKPKKKHRTRKKKEKNNSEFHSPSGNQKELQKAIQKHEEAMNKLFHSPTAKSPQEIEQEKKKLIHDISVERESKEDTEMFKFWKTQFNYDKKELKELRRYFQTLLRYDINNNVTEVEYKEKNSVWESGQLVKQINSDFYLNYSNLPKFIKTRRGNSLVVRDTLFDYNIKQILISLLYVMFGLINKKLHDNRNFPFIILFKGSRILHKYQNKNMDPYETIDLDLILFPKRAINSSTISDKLILEMYYEHINELKEISFFILKLCKYWCQFENIVNLSILEPPEINSNSDSNKKIFKLSYIHSPPNRTFSALIDLGFTWNLPDNTGINNHSNTLKFFKSIKIDKIQHNNNEFYIKPKKLDLLYIYQNKQNFINEKKYIRNKNNQENMIKDKMERQLKYLNIK